MTAPRTLSVRLVQLEVLPGRPEENTERILGHIACARRGGAALVAFPEMAIPGYLIGDEWERLAFIRECEACGHRIREAAEGIAVAFGNVGVDWNRRNEDGRVRKYNALFIAENRRFVRPEGTACDFAIKTLLPNYREFDDSRHFFDLRKLAMEEGRPVEELIAPMPAAGCRIGGVLCEDAWDADYAVSPLRVLGRKGADFVLNLSCSPFTLNKNHKRNRVFSALSTAIGRPLLYCNTVGIQNNGKTVFTFDGESCIYDGHGNQVRRLKPFQADCITFDLPLDGSAFGEPIDLRDDGIGQIHEALSYGTRRFMDLCGVKRVTVGISGGIDSAVVAAMYAKLLPPEDLLLVNMPGEFTSPTTRALAHGLAKGLGCLYAEVPIGDSVALTVRQLDRLRLRSLNGGLERDLGLSGFVRENIQARDRSARVLAAISAAFGGVFTCNANKAEATVGYTTLYGDLAGYLAMIADLWKGEVYALGRYLNERVYGAEVIPSGCFEIVPSAELSAAQNVDKGQGDPLVYPYHDCLFRSWVESWNRTTPEEILEWYLDGSLARQIGYEGRVEGLFASAGDFVADLERWWNQYQGMGLAKRIQAPPVLAVKRRAFGFDHREAQMGVRYTRRYQELKRRALGPA